MRPDGVVEEPGGGRHAEGHPALAAGSVDQPNGEANWDPAGLFADRPLLRHAGFAAAAVLSGVGPGTHQSEVFHAELTDLLLGWAGLGVPPYGVLHGMIPYVLTALLFEDPLSTPDLWAREVLGAISYSVWAGDADDASSASSNDNWAL